MRKKIIALFIFAFPLFAFAYNGTPTQQVDSFFQELQKGDHSKAVDNLYASNLLIQKKSQALTVMKQQLGMLGPLYGSLIGSELIVEEQLSPSLIRIVKVAKHESHPVIWEFYFYRAKDKWIISQGMFGDQFQFVDAKKK